MKVKHHPPNHQFIRLAAIVIVLLIFGLTLLPRQVDAHVQPPDFDPTSVENQPPQDMNCMHLMALRTPTCRSKALLFVASRWLVTHLRVDTAQWGLPVYVEFDQAEQWRRVSVFCLHLTRSGR
jgi:hypothetical protein